MRAIPLTFAVLLMLTPTPFAFQEHGHNKPAPAQPMAQALTDGPYIEQMTMHHEEGVKMAQLAADKASNAKVKEVAATLVTDQQRELKELEHLKMTVKDSGMGMGHGMEKEHGAMKGMGKDKDTMAKDMSMDELQKMSGAMFDQMFLDMMTKHHQEAIRMSRDAKLKYADVRDFARRTAQEQEKQVKAMQDLRKQVG